MKKIIFFVPSSHVDKVKQAVFAAGGGRMGNYDRCSWQVLGWGQFRPLSGSQPFVGDVEKVERLEEYRVEMVCGDKEIFDVVSALKQAHPYEHPAFEVIELYDIS